MGSSEKIERHQDEAEISRKQEENVKTLAKSISQEDNILKVKDTSSNKRASPEANKLKDAKIFTKSKEEQKDSALKNTSCDAQKSGNSISEISSNKNNEIKENDNHNHSNQSLTQPDTLVAKSLIDNSSENMNETEKMVETTEQLSKNEVDKPINFEEK